MPPEAGTATLLHWSAWTPAPQTLPSQEAGFESPPVEFVPMLLRRRMSRLSRMVVYVAERCCREADVSPDSVRVVFASYHGELLSTVGILAQIKREESVSPTDFTMSVHHSPVSILSLLTGNQKAGRAVAGGEESFCCGFLDSLGMLLKGEDPVLFLAGDDCVPLPFSKFVRQPLFPCAVALLLKKEVIPGKLRLSLSLDAHPEPGNRVGPISEIFPPLDFIKWLSTKESQWSLSSEKRRWTWTRHPQA